MTAERKNSGQIAPEIYKIRRPKSFRAVARAALCLLILSFFVTGISAQEITLKTKFQNDDFKLVYAGKTADIFAAPTDFKVVEIAAKDFGADIERVTDTKAQIKSDERSLSKNAVVIGTLGKNKLIDRLVREQKLDVSRIRGKWESFLITIVKNPLPNVETALIIAGSDRRGTAFGVYEMSQIIGVSPWVWWADVAPEKRENLIVSRGAKFGGEPSVKYRGIFLNDEDWGLQPWAAKTFEPEIGDIGPKTYAKIFELLLRLKANTCWPAMHEVTKPFNEIAANKQIADDYAIVMGSSHAEPMLRNNVGEWKIDKAKYNFVTNRTDVTNYWENRVAENGKFENIYTLGMRGIHDSPIQGTKSQTERIPVLENIIATQRGLLAEHVNENVAEIPQIFCPYKEVLADYRAGLRVPEDVTVVFPDDNFGYIRYFPNVEEQKRAGGFGVYYHISYLGRPFSYLWLNTTPPALIWEEMSKAYDHNMRRFWMLNVGDIKPGEIGIELFMQMAWDANIWRRENLAQFLETWARREFGARDSAAIARVMDEFYRLGFQRKPEHLQWHLPNEKFKPSDFSAVDYGDEMQKRLDAYESLKKRAETIYERLAPEKKDAFYELVLYPVRAAALANERFFAVEKSRLYAAQNRAGALEWTRRAERADAQIQAETVYFNEKLAGGKWRGMMSPEMGKNQWPSMRSTPPQTPDDVLRMKILEPTGLGVAVEGRAESLHEDEIGALPQFDSLTKETRFIDVFNTGKSPAVWTAKAAQKWIKLSQNEGNLKSDTRLQVSIDWRAIAVEKASGEIEIKAANQTRKVSVSAFKPKLPKKFKGFVESNGVISIEAENFTNEREKNGAGWQTISGLGRTGDSVSIFPTIAADIPAENILRDSPSLEYRFYSFTSGKFQARFLLAPTQPLRAGRGLRFAVSVDDEPPQIVSVGANIEVSSREWAESVLNASIAGTNEFSISAGEHVLKIFMIEAGVVLDKIVLDAGGLRPSYLAPPETLIR